ncbi:MAG: FmdB family zinc ribbon protein [Burkholderiaceae bacterium]|jgi:putative FmdB family regulatory protein
MPIYAYRCAACGFQKDVLQKMSDDPLTVCPQCQATAFDRQVTAAGFQLKGAGWYVTDFRDKSTAPAAPAAKTDAAVDSKPAAAAAAPATPAASKGGE